ncbi:hypothetical protein ACCO45_004060 [Purpureocillium lilacinum]|uniref:Uncharacterized protein n=1 Tax=Purpureocillium lilacinum TaxID=33203 RepID=A0ACC4E307_PURLI
MDLCIRLNMLRNLVIVLLATSVAGVYKCPQDSGVITIRDEDATAAMIAGAPAQVARATFQNQAIEDEEPVIFSNEADHRCFDGRLTLLQYPVHENGTVFPKNGGEEAWWARYGTRAVYTEDGKSLCGVMTHLPRPKWPTICQCERYRGCDYFAA